MDKSQEKSSCFNTACEAPPTAYPGNLQVGQYPGGFQQQQYGGQPLGIQF